jgi:hypothetical protein
MTITESDLVGRLMDSMDSLRGEISSLRVEMGKYSAGISLVDARVEVMREELKDLRNKVVETRSVCDNCDARKNIGSLGVLWRWAGTILAVVVSVAALGQNLNWWGR